jgi:uracil-DNA glycosylase
MVTKHSSTPLSTGSAADFIPAEPTLPKLREAAAGCRGCNLWINATQTVFGEGPKSAEVILVGEQPGDQEDRAGRVYVTNSVKHFKFVQIQRGRRLHKKPNAGEVRACHPWLQEEIRLVKPRVIVRVTRDRGKPIHSELVEAIVATVHPSAILRAPTEARDELEGAGPTGDQ